MSPTSNSIRFQLLTIDDLDAIHSLERATWPSYLQANRDLIAQRLAWGHVLLGAYRDGDLIAMTAWRYDHFSPNAADSLPSSFEAFANRPSVNQSNAAFVYNFELLPSSRGTRLAPQLVSEGIKILLRDSCTYLVAPSRCPSYHGSDEPLARCNQNPDIKDAIDMWPARSIPWKKDPILNFYHRVLNCTFIRPLKAFMPEDIASGGYAIGFYKKLG